MKIMTLILARNININTTIIEKIGKIIRKHIPVSDFKKTSLLVDFRGDDEPQAVAEIIKQIILPKKDKVFLIDDPIFEKEFATELATGLVEWIVAEKISGAEFVIIVCKSWKNYEPNQVVSHMSEAVLGKKFDFTPIFAV